MKLFFSILLLAISGTLTAQTPLPATHAGATKTYPRNDLSGTAISKCGQITSPGDYYLSRDLTCPGTGLMVSGPGIDLNLNGHTITYGTAGGTQQTVFGIENDACWDLDQKARTVPCDNTNAGVGVNIHDGQIVQSPNAPTFSDALYFGQNANNDQVINIHNLTITVQQTGSRGFYSSFLHGQVLFEHNTIYDNVKSINYPGQNDQQARAQFQGQAVHIESSTNMRWPDRIDNNKIIGAPQGGIRDTSNNPSVFENDISQNATYANDFCIDAPGANQQIYNNYCHPINGRGFHINGTGSRVYNNVLVVTEARVDREYGGCEGGGAFGIQLEDDIQAAGNVTVTGNTATLNPGACGGAALRITGWQGQSPASISGNTWIVNKTGYEGVYGDFLYSFDQDDLAKVKFGGDNLQTNDYLCVDISWDGVQNLNLPLNNCKAPYTLYSATNYDPLSTFILTGAPNQNYVCGEESNSHGTINGVRTNCPK